MSKFNVSVQTPDAAPVTLTATLSRPVQFAVLGLIGKPGANVGEYVVLKWTNSKAIARAEMNGRARFLGMAYDGSFERVLLSVGIMPATCAPA